MPAVHVRYEQAVYGSFPFWDKGYAVLARSPGCRDEWIADLRVACQRYGERPAGAADAGGLMVLKLPSGPRAIVGPCPQGCDDRGRPGALAFHALFVSSADYKKAGAFPFDLARNLCNDWTVESVNLPSGEMILDDVPPSEPTPTDDPLARRIARAISQGKRVALEAPGPIDDLARKVWLALPLPRRGKLSLATWAFGVGNSPDLVALPRLAGIALDRTYVDPASLQENESLAPLASGSGWTGFRLIGRLFWLGFALLGLTTLGLAWREEPHPSRPAPIPDSHPAEFVPPVANRPTPPSRPEQSRPLSAFHRRQIEDGLISLAERFGTLDSTTNTDLDALMQRLRERLTYRDPILALGDLADLSRQPDAGQIPAWHESILHFLPDRPLPDDFSDGPIDWQLRVLAWSFHLDSANRPADEIPRFLAESLSLPHPIRSTPLTDGIPTLKDYVRFLRRLPVR